MLLSHQARTAMAEGLRVALGAGPNPAELQLWTPSNVMLGVFPLPALELASHGTLRMPGPAIQSVNGGPSGTVTRFRIVNGGNGAQIDGTLSLTTGDLVVDDATTLNAANMWLDSLVLRVGLTGALTVSANITPNAP